MANNYTYPYMNSQMNLNAYNGMNNYPPVSNIGLQNQPAPNPYYPIQYPINNQRFGAFFVNDYSEVKNAVVSSDGSPSLFMMNEKDVFYIKKVGEDGRTILKSYNFTEYTDEHTAESSSEGASAQSNELASMKQEMSQIKGTLNKLIESLNATFAKPEEKVVADKTEEIAKPKFSASDF